MGFIISKVFIVACASPQKKITMQPSSVNSPFGKSSCFTMHNEFTKIKRVHDTWAFTEKQAARYLEYIIKHEHFPHRISKQDG